MQNPIERASAFFVVLFVFVIPHSSFCLSADPASPEGYAAAGWPQQACTPGRTGVSPDSPRPPFTLAWQRMIPNERIALWNQPVLAEGKVFIGTVEGVMHCWPLDSAGNPKDLWTFAAEGPILQSAAYDNGRLFFGAMDGCVYALNAADGSVAWKHDAGRPGFSTAALVADGRLFLGSRRGVLHAFDLNDGKLVWSFDAGAPYYASAAFADGMVYAPCEDMAVSAFDAASGERLWQSDHIHGTMFARYYPVAAFGKLAIRTAPNITIAHKDMSYSRHDRIPGAPGGYPAWHIFPADAAEAGEKYFAHSEIPLAERLAEFSATVRAAFEKEPEALTFHVLDAKTGKEPYVCPVIYNEVQVGPGIPPLAGPDGFWYVGTTVTCVGNACSPVKLDPATGDIVDILVDHIRGETGSADGWGGKCHTVLPDGSLDKQNGAFMSRFGMLTGDEDDHYAIGGGVIYGRHGHGGWDALDLRSRKLLADKCPAKGCNAYSSFAISGPYLVGTSVYGRGLVYCVKGESFETGGDQ